MVLEITRFYMERDEEINSTSRNGLYVNGAWSDRSVWRSVIPNLKNAGHKVVAVQLPFQSLAGDADTVKIAVEHIGSPAVLVGHSYGGEVISNAAYNNSRISGLVFIAAFALDEGESLWTYVDPATQYQKNSLFLTTEGLST